MFKLTFVCFPVGGFYGCVQVRHRWGITIVRFTSGVLPAREGRAQGASLVEFLLSPAPPRATALALRHVSAPFFFWVCL